MIFKASLGIGQLKDFPGIPGTVARCSAITCFLLLRKCPFPPPLPVPEHQQTWNLGKNVPSGLLLPAPSPFPSELKCQFFRKTLTIPQTHKPNGSPTSLRIVFIRKSLSHTDAWVSFSEILIQLFQDATWASFLRTPQKIPTCSHDWESLHYPV